MNSRLFFLFVGVVFVCHVDCCAMERVKRGRDLIRKLTDSIVESFEKDPEKSFHDDEMDGDFFSEEFIRSLYKHKHSEEEIKSSYNTAGQFKKLAKITIDGKTALHITITTGNSALLEKIAEFSDVNAVTQDKECNTALHLAVMNTDFPDMLGFLLKESKQDIKMNKKNGNGLTPLMLAAWTTNASAVQLLLAHGADVHERSLILRPGSTALHLAVEAYTGKARFLIVDYLLHYGADINAQCALGRTPLHLATLSGYRELVYKLHGHDGLNPNIADVFQQAPLHIAVIRKSLPVISELLQREETDINIQDKFQETPLHKASRLQDIGMIICLRQSGAHVDIRNHAGRKPSELFRLPDVFSDTDDEEICSSESPVEPAPSEPIQSDSVSLEQETVQLSVE